MKTKLSITSFILLALAASAQAHIGVDHQFTLFTGAEHPLTGLDHILAMLGIGLWAAIQGGKARWLVPCTFVTIMAAGSLLGYYGVALPAVESGIAVSVLILGLLIASMTRLPLAAGMALTAAFALFHGHAHGAEAPADGSFWAFGAGFVLATAILHLVGYGVGHVVAERHAKLIFRTGGGIMAGIGAMLLAQSF